MPLDEAALARWLLFGIAAAAIAIGLWYFLKREPPRRSPVFAPTRR